MDKKLKHIAIIPDGNRRWAKARRFNPWQGHEEGVKRFWEITAAAADLGIDHLTIWTSSYDNLKKRSKAEVSFLLKLLRDELSSPKLLEQIHKNQSKVQVFGEWEEFVDKKTTKAVEKLVADTAHYKKHHLTLLFAYDGQREMIAAINQLVAEKKTVNTGSIQKALWTGHLPEVDLVVRTGGEPHWSAGFMMWLTANSQFYFTKMLWPDFKKMELKKAIAEYDRRERRLGK